MRCNLATWDRILRFLIGVLALSYAIAGGPPWLFLGIYFIFSAAWGFCTLYAFFRIQTLKGTVSREFFKK